MNEDLTRALRHLYDLAFLETSPLAAHLKPEPGTHSRGAALRRAIVEAIELLRPPAGTSVEASSWRAYQILEGRYIAGMTRAEVQGELALAKSQFYRDHTKAVEALASILCDRWQSEPAHDELGAEASVSQEDALEQDELLALRELDELVRHEDEQRVDLWPLLVDVSDLVTATLPSDRRIVLALEESPLMVRTRPGVFRQGLLLTLAGVARHTCWGDILLSASGAGGVTLFIRVEGQTVGDALDRMSRANRDVMMGFIAAAGGKVQVAEAPVRKASTSDALVIRYSVGQATRSVLLVDNSRELADLYARYLEGQPWALRYAGSVVEAIAHCADKLPAIVLLDVLMPDRDGWHLLAQLKRDDRTRHVPVVICSVLDQPQLALSLGATGYLRKPISRQGLVDALDRWALTDSRQRARHPSPGFPAPPPTCG